MTGLYTPTIEEVFAASTGRSRPIFDAQFYRWLTAHEAEVRSDEKGKWVNESRLVERDEAIRADEREQAAQRVGALFHPTAVLSKEQCVAAARGENNTGNRNGKMQEIATEGRVSSE